jgi:hypothetical protein
MRSVLPASVAPITTFLFLSLVLSLLFPMPVSADPDSSFVRKRTHGQQLGIKFAIRAPPSSSSHPPESASTLPTPSETGSTPEAPISSSHSSSISTTTPSSPPPPSPTTRSPTPTSSSSPVPSSSAASSPSPSIFFTTSTSTQSSQVLSSSTSTTQPSSSSISSTSSTSTVPSAVTTINVPLPTSYPSTFGQLPQTSTTSVIAAAQTSTARSPKGFFANTGAVAGTFTVVGLAVVALLATLLICICKRRHSPDDADDAFFEKIPAPTSYDGGGGDRGLASLSPVYPPPTHAYSDDGYTSNVHDSGYRHEAEPYAVHYPLATSYTTQQHQDAYNASRSPRATSPTSSRFPNPFDSPLPREVPAPAPVNIRDSSIAYGVPHESRDSFYGAGD